MKHKSIYVRGHDKLEQYPINSSKITLVETKGALSPGMLTSGR